MPSILEYWTTMAYSTCNNYLKRYTDVAALKAGIQRHAFSNGVQINIGENINDIARFRQGIPKQKRPIAKNILEAPPPKRARIAEVFSDIRIENAQVPMQIEELQAAVVDALPAIAVNGARKPLVLNGITIEVDPQTLMVNATQMCRAAGKLFGDYHRNKCYKDFENELSEAMGIPIANLTKCENGNREGTWVHRRIALYLAQKISPLFAVQVTGWIDELRIENDQLLTQIEELQAAVDAPPAIAVNGARKPLVLNGIIIEVDPQTLMVNATQMCRAAGKEFANYSTTIGMIQYLNALESNLGIPRLNLITSNRGGNHSGTWVHRLVAYDLARWLSAEVSLQFTMWIDELRIENTQLLTQIEELQAAAVYAPSAIVVVDAPYANAVNGAEIIEFSLKLSNGADFIVPVRRDGYVNVTKICQAAGKRLQHYKDRAENKHFLDRYVVLTRIRASTLIEANEGNCTNRGTFAHPDIAIHIAQWCSADFSIQVSQWVRQLMLTGRVELGNEMSPQQLDNAWQQRVQEEQARHQQATEALETRHRQATEALETRITTMELQGELEEEKTREELDAAIKTLARDTEQLPQFPDGANVLYAGYIGNWLIKYGQSSNFTRRLAEHRRHYPDFMLIKALSCDNAVASEKKLREFVAKKNIGGNYNNEKEIIGFKTQEDVYKLIGAMQRSCRNKDSAVSVELKRIEADVTIQTKKIEAEIKRIEAEVEIKRMDVEKDKIETMRMELLMQDKITFEQYLQMK